MDGDTHALQTANTRLDGLTKYYPSYYAGSAIKQRFYRFLADHRIPADEIYTGPKTLVPQLRPASEFVELLGKERMRVITLLDVGKLNGTDRTWPKVLSNEFVDGVVGLINASLEQLGLGNSKHAGLLPADLAADVIANRRVRIYGFDESAPSSATAMRQLYGAIKKEFDWLRTMATVNAFTIPGDMPLDVSAVPPVLFDTRQSTGAYQTINCTLAALLLSRSPPRISYCADFRVDVGDGLLDLPSSGRKRLEGHAA